MPRHYSKVKAKRRRTCDAIRRREVLGVAELFRCGEKAACHLFDDSTRPPVRAYLCDRCRADFEKKSPAP